jgi:hypothetical protein
MARHHFVPQFMLSRWATRGRLKSYGWNEEANKTLESTVAVRTACQIKDLNSFYRVPRAKREMPERDFSRQK